MTTPREVLEVAVTSLEEEGWRKNALGDYYNAVPHCTFGAIFRARVLLQGTGDYDGGVPEAQELVRESLPKYWRERDADIAKWNDSRHRTKEQVIDVFKQAIKLAIIREEST